MTVCHNSPKFRKLEIREYYSFSIIDTIIRKLKKKYVIEIFNSTIDYTSKSIKGFKQLQ